MWKFTLILVSFLTTVCPDQDCMSQKADLVFLLDASGSQGLDNFKKQLNFVKTVTGALDVRPDGVRVGLVTFSTQAVLQFNLKDHMDKTELHLAIGSVPYEGGGTNTDVGLRYVREKSFTSSAGERPDAQNVVVLFTDGASRYPVGTLREARLLRKKRSIIFSVGIGQMYRHGQLELDGIASGKNYSITISDFDALEKSLPRIQSLLCDAFNGKIPSGCLTRKGDVVFLLDASTSEGLGNFKKQLNFVKSVTGGLDVRPDGVRVGLVTFSTQAHLQFNLKDHMDKKEQQMALGFVAYQDGLANTEVGLRYVREKSFTSSAGERPDAQNVVVALMTQRKSIDSVGTRREARLLRANGAIIVSLGIGQIDKWELDGIASGKKYSITVSDFDALGQNVSRIRPLVCGAINGKKPKELYVPCEERAIDLAILLDGSASEGQAHFREQANFAADFVSQLVIAGKKTQVGAITFSTDVNRQFFLNRYDDTQSVVNAIKQIPYTGGSTNTQKALDFMRKTFFDPAYGRRPGVPKVILIITDGRSRNRRATLRQARLLKQEGFIVFAVGIGNTLIMTEVNTIASDSTMAYHVKSFNDLQALLPTLQTAYCQMIEEAPPVILTDDPNALDCSALTDVVFVLDSSSSEGLNNFRKQVKFAGNVTKQLEVGPNSAQVSFMTFSSSPKNYFYLNRYDNKYDVIDAMSRSTLLPYYGGATYTDAALRYVRTKTLSTLHGRRLGAQPIVIILTDGKSSDPNATLAEARLLKSTGAAVIVIGIGPMTDDAELTAIASHPSYKFNVNHFDFLVSIQKQIVQETCEGGGPPPAPHSACTSTEKADIMIIIDSSSDDSNALFKHEIGFVIKLVDGFTVGPQNTQFSLMTFATTPQPEFWFNQYATKQQIKDALLKVVYTQGETNTHEALKFARQDAFKPPHGARNDSRQYVLIVTDGIAADLNKTISEANFLKKQGVTIMAVGIGQNADQKELEDIATDPTHVFIADKADALRTIHQDITARTCKSIFELKPTPVPAPS